MFKRIKSAFGYTATNRVISKEAEYKLYEKVSQDIAAGERDEGVWTSAFAKSEGDNQRAEAKYIELMVQRYKDWIEAGKELSEILEKSIIETEEVSNVVEEEDAGLEEAAIRREAEEENARRHAAGEIEPHGIHKDKEANFIAWILIIFGVMGIVAIVLQAN